MNREQVNQVIDELIELSNTKYSFIKVGRDTLNIDILFIERYSMLKELLGSELDTIDLTQFPNIKELQVVIEKINSSMQHEERDVRMAKATKAYQKK